MLNRWDPFYELSRVQDRLFRAGDSEVQPGFRPAVDIYEDADALHLRAELPGIKPEDVKVQVDNNVLTISGERKLEKSEDRKGYHRVERAYGSFTRSFALHDGVDASGIEAGYKDRLLNLRVPKVKRPEAKSIEIKVA